LILRYWHEVAPSTPMFLGHIGDIAAATRRTTVKTSAS
jgi:hypothetical protein